MVSSRLTWRRRLKGRHELKVSLRTKALINVGQLGWVKLLPKPPSNGCGKGAPALGALMIDVGDETDDEVEVPEGATMEEGDPVSVDAIALAVDEKVVLPAADEAGTDEDEGESNAELETSAFCRRSRPTMGDGRRSTRIPPPRIDLPRPNLGVDSHCSPAAAGTHTAVRSSIAERNNCMSVGGSGASPRPRRRTPLG